MPTASATPPPGRGNRARAFLRDHRRAISIIVSGAAVVGFVVFVLPQINGLSGTLRRLRSADPAWIALALALEAASLGGYGLLFRTVFCCHGVRIGWREAYQITLAGTVASKLLSTAGAGGVALTVWALRASGLSPSVIARRMLAFELLLYSVFAAALTLAGSGLRTGVLAGNSPWALTVVPAVVGALAIIVTIALSVIPQAPSTLREAIRIAGQLVRTRRGTVLGAVGYWGLDIATLWASLHAFGTPPPFATIVMAYFVGQLGNVLPLPGGVGGVEGGMIAALIAFGAPGSLAVLGVLAYRLISFWLPTVPGGVAYLRLRVTVARWRRLDGEPASVPGHEPDVSLGVGDSGTVRDVANLARGRSTPDGVG